MTQIDRSSDDEDSSPEEEGLSTGQQEIQQQLREREEAQRREQKILKQQRRKQDEMFRKQREEKFLRAGSRCGTLEEMPMEILETSQKERQINSAKREAPRHITFHGEVGEGTSRKKNRLSMLKVKRGPVTVQLLSKGSSQLPPRTERPVMREREKWLRRRSVRRK